MDEEFEKLLMINVRGQQLINWLSCLREILEQPIDSYSRFHRKMFSILVVELMNDGLKYISMQKDRYTQSGSRYLGRFFTIIYNGVAKFKDAMSDDEYIYLYHLRNCAGHIFPVGYDNVDLEGNIKTHRKGKFQTKEGKREMTLDEIEYRLNGVILRYGVDDRKFLKRIYNLSLEHLAPMLRELYEYEQNHTIK